MKKIISCALIFCPFLNWAQTSIPLADLSPFKLESNNWSIVGDVMSSTTEKNTLLSSPGTGVLICKHDSKEWGTKYDLFTKEEYGDMDLSLEFMLGEGSNSGIYLQSRYEIQLFDSWGVKNPKYYDCGGIYQRRDISKPDGQNQYEGYAPRYNAYKAPGLWNSMEISYQAPRFDAAGKKTSNAKILFVKLNGLLIHENVELSGPTGGPIEENEVAKAPLRIQGDHGSVAFRNIVINNFDRKASTVSDLTYKAYYGSHMHDADLSKVKIDAQGKASDITWEVSKEQNNYVFYINGKYNAPETGDYTFTTQLGGHSYLKIDGKEVLDNRWMRSGDRSVTINLTKGEHTFEIFNNKRDGWIKPALGFWSAGPGFRMTPHHSAGSVIASKPTDPIIVYAKTNTNLRSFMDWKKKPEDANFRAVHAISVGSPENIHYTYDLDKGAIMQAWKGDFLDTTPMWDDRGDGSSRPLGSLTLFNHDLLLNPQGQSAWKLDTTGTGYRPLGYDLDENDLPTFNYSIAGQKVSDKIRIVDGKFLDREVKISNGSNLVARIASGDVVERIAPNLYAVDGKKYFIKLEKGSEAVILNKSELLVRPSDNTVKYAIIF
jgi:hypothetical protein